MVATVSRDDVLAVMPFPTLTRITGEPTYQDMKKWRKEMSSNLISVRMPVIWGQNKGLLGELQDPAVFLARNGAAYNPPLAAPPAYPVIVAGATTAEREQARAEHAIESTNWQTANHGRRIAVNIGAAAFEAYVYAELGDPDKGLNDVNIRMLYDHVMDRFAKISQLEIDSNLESFNEGIDPSKTLAVYTRKQELCQETANDADVPITEATMVTTGTKHAVATGGMDQAWKEWMRTLAANRTWPNWKTHWTAAFQDKRELVKLTGIAFNGMANSAQESELGDKMVSALDNLANAAVQKNDTFEQLVLSNKTLTESIRSQQDEIKKLLAIITALSTSDRESGRTPSGGGKTSTAPGASGGGGGIPWDPVGYCWSHGFKVKMSHSSATCANKKEGHDSHLNAKRGDEQGGCKWNEKWKAK
jgi:hypothetical protein